MVINGPPGAGGIAGGAEVALAVGILTAADGAGSCLHHIAGLGADDLEVTGEAVLDPPEEPVGKHLAVRMVFRGGRFVLAGVQHLPAQVVFHGGPEDQGHIGDSAVVVFIVKPHAVGKMGSVRNAQLLQLLIHQLHEGLLGTGDVNGQPQGCVSTGGEDGAVKQFPDRDRFPYHQPHDAAFVDVAVVCDIDGHGKSIVQMPGDVLGTHQQCQHLGHGGGADAGTGVLFRQDGAGIFVNENGIAAVDGVIQLDCVRVGGNGVDRRFRLRDRFHRLDGLRGRDVRLFRQGFCAGTPAEKPGGEGNSADDGDDGQGDGFIKQLPPPFQLPSAPGLCTLTVPGLPLFFGDGGGVVFVHVCAPVM